MKKILIAMLPLIFLGACKKDITSLNVDPKHPKTVPAALLFTQAQRVLTSTLFSTSVYTNTYRLFEQQWQETTYITESNYDIKDNKIPDGQWAAMYRDVLENFEQSRSQLPNYVTNVDEQKNDAAMIDIMEVYAYYYLVTTFGNIPYTEALKETTAPKYDDAATVYKSLLTRLDADIAALNTSAGSFGSADLVYGGNITMWKKFANTFKLKMGITIADYDATLAKTVTESAVAAGVFTNNEDNANFNFDKSSPNTNPIWVGLVQSGRQDFIAANTIITALKANNDPRLPLFFTPDSTKQIINYSGGLLGKQNSYDAFSKPSTTITQPGYPGLLLDYSETEFNLAEAVERGFNVGGTAATHYSNAITASIAFWGGSAANASAYLAQSSVSYATATGDYRQKIGTQKWLALYNRGWDAWIENRRLDYPKLPKPAAPVSDFPLRLTYPVVEQNVNTVNYNAAAAAIGGDQVTTKLFFDKL